MEKQTRPRIILLFGGRGLEHDISIMSADYIYSLTDKEKYDILPIYISRAGDWLATDGISPNCTGGYRTALDCSGGIILNGKFLKVDAALPVLHGDFGEDGVVQGALENARISYIGCDVTCGALCADKAFTKSIARELGIDTARHTISKRGESEAEFASRAKELGFPLFIKPARLGSSFGAAAARDESELRLAVNKAFKLSKRVLAEEYIDIKSELECAYFEAMEEKIFSDVGSIVSHGKFYDYESKYLHSDAADVDTEAQISADIRKKIIEQSAMLADALGVRHLSRFDFLLANDGRLIFNEINTFPGFTGSSLYPRLISRAGIAPHTLVDMLISEVLS